MNVIGIDFGGTKINFTLMSDNTVIKSHRIETGKITKKEDIIKKITEGLSTFDNDYEAVGIGIAGMIDHKNGEAVFLTNLGGISHFFLAEALEKNIGKSVYIENDVNVALFGESRVGVMSENNSGIFIAVGTGIGGAIMLSGKLYVGKYGFAGEFGHITVRENGLRCGCGKRGCLETISSGSGIERYVKSRIKNRETKINEISAKKIIDYAEKGDILAAEAVNDATHFLARVSGDLINIFNPEIIIFGGGVMESDFIFAKVKKEIWKFALPALSKDIIITRSKLKNNAGSIGAALLAEELLKGKKIYI